LDAGRFDPPAIPFQRQAVVAADFVHCVSRYGVDYLSSRFPEVGSRALFSPLGVTDLGALPPPSSDGVIRALSVSSIDQNKRVEVIASALALVAEAGAVVEWTHIGDGPGRHELLSLLRASEATNMRWNLMGAMPLESVHEALKQGPWDVFINASTLEGAPVSLMEAQCVGIPCVVTCVGGSTEVATADLNIVLQSGCTAEQLADGVKRALALPASFRARRRAHWRREYNAEVNGARFASTIAAIASGRSDSFTSRVQACGEDRVVPDAACPNPLSGGVSAAEGLCVDLSELGDS
jgi:glycosyltransferase involved in cell wall biosynthesis